MTERETFQPEPEPERKKRVPLGTRVGIIASVAASAFGVAYMEGWFDEPGRLRSSDPAAGSDPHIDQELDVVTWNMHGQLRNHLDDIERIIATRDNDVFSFQEVLERDYEALDKRFEDWGLVFVVADPNTKPFDGPFGNILMTRQKPEDVHRDIIPGTSKAESIFRSVNGLRRDARTDDKQEDRAVMVQTIKVWDADAGREQDVKIVNAHISGARSVHQHQLEETMDFIEDQLEPDTPLVFAGDLNGYPDEIRNAFLELRMSVPLTDQEIALGSPHQVDYFAEYPAGVLGVPEVAPLTEYRTDHYPIEAVYDTDSPGE